MNLQDKLMLIDGNSILNRAFYGLKGPKMLSTSDGFYTNALYGFLNILIKFMNDEKPTHLAVAFDMKSPTFRHVQYENYKAHRKGMPEELAMQMPVLKELLDAMNIKRFEIPGYEADDIIGTLSKNAERAGIDTVIITGDRDSLQLVSEKIRVKIPTTRGGKTETDEYDTEEIVKKYGVTPLQLIDVKGLMGDASDNIPGVPGIGEKTALEMIKKYKSLENIYSNIESLEAKERIKNLLVEHKALADMSKELSAIDINAPIDSDVCNCDIKEYNLPVLIEILKRLEFNSMISKLNLNIPEGDKKNNLILNYKYLTDNDELAELERELEDCGEFAYFPIIKKNDELQTELKGISLCWGEDKTAYIALDNIKNDIYVKTIIKKIFSHKSLKKYTFNAKPQYSVFDSLGAELDLVDFDLMIAAYLLNPAKENYTLFDLCNEFLDISISDTLKYDKNDYKDCDINEIAKIACEQAAVIYQLSKLFKSKIEEYGQTNLYFDVELPLTRVLADMEKHGIMVDSGRLDKLSHELEAKIDNLSKEIIDIAGENFNINSPKQLGMILFEKLGLPAVKKTKTGYSTDVEVLENLSSKHPIIDKILEYRQMVKIKSTYADGMRPMINSASKRVHSNFNQTVTVTGRISSTEPNLQNIPIKLETGRQIRKVFIAPEGCLLVDADYSQIELRVLAHISNDANMIQAFKERQDIHRSTAAKIFGVREDEVTPHMRSSAKAINFGLIYGKGEFSLAKDLKITRKEAREYIDNYFDKFNGVKAYMADIIQKAKEQGYVSTLHGRRRYLPEIKASNFNIRAGAERMALNTPIQGTAADIIKIAMVKVHTELKEKGLKSRLILQVHDELIIETFKDELEEVKDILRSCMESAFELKVPLDVDLHYGQNWYEAK